MKKTSMKALSLLLALALCLPTFLMVAANEGEGSEVNAIDEKVNVTTEAEYESLYVHDVDGDGVSDLCFFYDAFSHTAEDGVPTEIVDRFGNKATLVDNKIKFIIRIPLIPTVTDTEKNLTEICGFLQSLSIDYAELLPYNKMAGGKYSLAGKKYEPQFDTNAEPQIHRDIFEGFGIRVKVM